MTRGAQNDKGRNDTLKAESSLQRNGDLSGYTEPLGILQQQLDLVPLEQVAVHAGVVVVAPGVLLHEQVQPDGCVAFAPVDVVLEQNRHHGIDTIPVGLSAALAVAAEEEQVAQLR